MALLSIFSPALFRHLLASREDVSTLMGREVVRGEIMLIPAALASCRGKADLWRFVLTFIAFHNILLKQTIFFPMRTVECASRLLIGVFLNPFGMTSVCCCCIVKCKLFNKVYPKCIYYALVYALSLELLQICRHSIPYYYTLLRLSFVQKMTSFSYQ